MASPSSHSLISPSNLHRVLHCTAAPRYEEQFPAQTSVYAQEGTLAHSVCEVTAQYQFSQITKRRYNSEIKKFQKEAQWNDEMVKTAEFYAQYLWERSIEFAAKPYTVQEVRVDLTDYIPDGFGTCDSVMIGGDTLHITDYKHGKGVEVSAEGNAQMRMYALGALKKYRPIYGDAIQKVTMAIVQPRITEHVSTDTMTVTELLAWGESIKAPIAEAYAGNGTFHAGDWCRFCRGRSVCRARSENATALEEFKELAVAGRMTPAEQMFSAHPMLTDEEIGDLLTRGQALAAWLADLQDYARDAILSGKNIAGWKVVEGRSNRVFSDPEAALAALKGAGYTDEQLYKTEPNTLSALEKLVGKSKFADIVGDLITKPHGKPTLVVESDKRPPYNPASVEFEGVAQS